MQHFTAHLHDEAGTLALGAAMARTLAPGLTIYLYGDLGAGKTALARAMLHAAGHQGHVKSPTYTLVEPYAVTVDGALLAVRHFDLYRLTGPEEFLDAGFRDEFDGRQVCIVEWPEKAAAVLPSPDIALHLNIAGEGRKVELTAHSDLGNTCLDRLRFFPNL